MTKKLKKIAKKTDLFHRNMLMMTLEIYGRAVFLRFPGWSLYNNEYYEQFSDKHTLSLQPI